MINRLLRPENEVSHWEFRQWMFLPPGWHLCWTDCLRYCLIQATPQCYRENSLPDPAYCIANHRSLSPCQRKYMKHIEQCIAHNKCLIKKKKKLLLSQSTWAAQVVLILAWSWCVDPIKCCSIKWDPDQLQPCRRQGVLNLKVIVSFRKIFTQNWV